MKKPTKQQRHEAYKKAHEIISNLKKDDYKYICVVLECILGYEYNTYDNTKLLPEFDLFKPKEHAIAWFGYKYGFHQNYESKTVKEAQKTVLEFCIEMTKTK